MGERDNVQKHDQVREFAAQVSRKPQKTFSPGFLVNVISAINKSTRTEPDNH